MVVGIVGVSAELSVQINGVELETDVPPMILNNRTMVPLRAIAEALDARVEWNQELQMITIYNDERACLLIIDDNRAVILNASGDAIVSPLDVPPTIIDNRTLVPVRFFAEFFDSLVDWDGANQIVGIYTL
jgi:hypothetical protein